MSAHKGYSPTLVLIVGPIASGKSSVARELADRFRKAGRPAATVDLDDVVAMMGGFAGLSEERFRQAQTVFGQLVGAWLREGIDVIAHGPLFQPHEDLALTSGLPQGVAPRRVLLQASYATAVERVRGDSARTLSRDLDLLRRTYTRVDELLPTMPASEWVFDTDSTDLQTIVDQLAQELVDQEKLR